MNSTNSNQYLILCLKNGRSRKLGMALWWQPNSAGYTTIVDQAGRYTKAEAEAICRPGENVAILEAEVLEKTVRVVRDFYDWEDETFKDRWYNQNGDQSEA